MPLLCLGLFFEICNTINQHDQKQIHFLSLILLILLDKRSLLMIPLVLLPVINSILSLIVCIVQVSSKSLEDIKLILIDN